MEECTLRTCVDRFNNRRYLTGQLNVMQRNNAQAPAGNVSNQMAYASGNIGLSSNGNNGPNNTNGMGSCISQSTNGNHQQQPMVINDLNEPYDNSGVVELSYSANVSSIVPEKCYYSPGFGAWDYEQIKLSDEFKKHYEEWLQREVYNMKIDWDALRTAYDIEMYEADKKAAENMGDKDGKAEEIAAK